MGVECLCGVFCVVCSSLLPEKAVISKHCWASNWTSQTLVRYSLNSILIRFLLCIFPLTDKAVGNESSPREMWFSLVQFTKQPCLPGYFEKRALEVQKSLKSYVLLVLCRKVSGKNQNTLSGRFLCGQKG